MNRIVSIGVLTLSVFLYGCQSDKKGKNKEDAPPNIVFIMTDDHAFQALSAYGHPIGKLAPTPNIDRIARNGALFTQGFCTNSLCGPSRAVILTGKHSHVNGFRQNGERFDGSQETLPKILQKMGYETALVGKWHLYGYPQGFDYWNIIVDQGNYYNPDFIHNGDTTRIEGYATDIITGQAVDWLKSKRDKKKPFYLMVHHKAPHRNWMPALRHINKYDSITFPVPDTYFATHEGQIAAQQQLQTIYKDMYEGHDLKMTAHYGSPELAHNPWKTDFNRMTPEQRAIWDKGYQAKNDAMHQANYTGKALAEWKEQRFLQEYLATVASVDEGVGEVLDYLEASGLDENTIIVYTSDQGFYLGEKGFFDKRFMYEESFRTPLLIQYKGHIDPGSKVNAMVQNLDFAQTFLDYAGGNEYTGEMQGESLKPLLDHSMKEEDFRDVIYYHYYDYPAFHMVKKHYGIRTKRYKIMHFYDDIDEWEFYDMEKDPKELYNAINDEAYQDIIGKMKIKLDSVQKVYGVTDREFEKAPEQKIEKAYENFKKLRGTPME